MPPASSVTSRTGTKDDRSGSGGSKRVNGHQAPPGPHRGFTKPGVAELSIAEIRRMSTEELAAAIRAAQVPLLQETVIGRLKYYDRTTLEQLVFLARRTVRNQGY